MQTLCDVIGMPIKVVRSEQVCALGAAMFASVAAGVHKDITEAQKAMCSGFSDVYTPNFERKRIFDKLYQRYIQVGNHINHNLIKL